MTTQDHQFSALYYASSALAGVCDGAKTQDGIGYNGQDTKFGHRVVLMGVNEWDMDIACEVYKMLRIYRNQLAGYGIDYDKLENPGKEGEGHDSRLARDKARQAEYQRKNAPYVSFVDKWILVHNSYPIKGELKPNGFAFDPRHVGSKAWESTFDVDSASTILGIPSIVLTDEQHDKILKMADSGQKTEKPVITEEKPANFRICTDHPSGLNKDFPDNHLILEAPYGVPPLAVTQALPGRAWDRKNKVNHLLPSIRLLDVADEYKLTISSEARELIETVREEQEAEDNARKAMVAESFATDTNVEVALSDYMRPYQKAGTAYMISRNYDVGGIQLNTAMNADEMGLGKTCQALAAIETKKAFPCLIACPASLTLNWQREIQSLLPHRHVRVLTGHASGWDLPECDFTIMSYEVVGSYIPYLYKLGGLVCDEAQSIKNPKSVRSKAIMRIAGVGVEEREDEETGKKFIDALPGLMKENGSIYLLTGTPVMNRPAELVPLLLSLGVLTRESGAENSVGNFMYRFCAKRDKSSGQVIQGFRGHPDFGGANHLDELHLMLRQKVMVGRMKTDVMSELPPKIRAPQFITLDRADFALYEKMAQEGAERAANSLAQALVYMNALRSAVGTAKISSALNWANDFLESEKSLVIFADHVDVQTALVRGLQENGHRVVQIKGGQKKSDTEEAKRAFQAKEANVIVCSLKAGGVGHTLTAASDVLIVEQGWNPATQDQAEDRCHRIGQEDSVTAWYILAQDTFDQWMYELVEAKRSITNMINRGVSDIQDEESVFSALLDRVLTTYGNGPSRTFTIKEEELAPREEMVRNCEGCGEMNLCSRNDDESPWLCLTCDNSGE